MLLCNMNKALGNRGDWTDLFKKVKEYRVLVQNISYENEFDSHKNDQNWTCM